MALEDLADALTASKKDKKDKKTEKSSKKNKKPEKVKEKVKAEKTSKKEKKEKSVKPAKAKAEKAKVAKPAKVEAKKEKKAAISDKTLLAAAKSAKLFGGKLDVSSSTSVANALSDIFVTSFNKTYSERTIVKVGHDNKAIEKALKGSINIANVRESVVGPLVKKVLPIITRAAAKAEAGKLTGAEYKELAAKVKEIFA